MNLHRAVIPAKAGIQLFICLVLILCITHTSFGQVDYGDRDMDKEEYADRAAFGGVIIAFVLCGLLVWLLLDRLHLKRGYFEMITSGMISGMIGGGLWCVILNLTKAASIIYLIIGTAAVITMAIFLTHAISKEKDYYPNTGKLAACFGVFLAYGITGFLYKLPHDLAISNSASITMIILFLVSLIAFMLEVADAPRKDLSLKGMLARYEINEDVVERLSDAEINKLLTYLLRNLRKRVAGQHGSKLHALEKEWMAKERTPETEHWLERISNIRQKMYLRPHELDESDNNLVNHLGLDGAVEDADIQITDYFLMRY